MSNKITTEFVMVNQTICLLLWHIMSGSSQRIVKEDFFKDEEWKTTKH